MRLGALLACAGIGMLGSSAAALAVPLPREAPQATALPPEEAPPLEASPHLAAGKTLLMDARIGHATLPKGSSNETYVFASVTAIEGGTSAAPPIDLAIVIDRSGSMKGARISNAIAAAVSAVDRMREMDRVVVVSFDTEAQVVVPLTPVSVSTRPAVEAAIRNIRLGGDTCISCGLQEARRQLDFGRGTGENRIERMLLLSDGATNAGIRDMAGLRALAARMRDRSAISTIGVDVDFDERVMGAIAAESNGNHYFVAEPTALRGVFDQEFDTLLATVARDAEVIVEPAPGVVIEEVFDRPSRRDGGRVIVPLGSFSSKDEKSALLKLRVPADHDGARPVVELKLAYRDLLEKADASFSGMLGAMVKADAVSEMDPFVRARVERSETARALADANVLAAQGRFAEAKAELERRKVGVDNARASVRHAPPSAPAPARARGFNKDFDDQSEALDRASQAAGSAASAAPTSRSAKEAPKKIQQIDRSDPFR